MAYEANASGLHEVYVAPFPGPGPGLQVSDGGGERPRWSPDGEELYYRRGDQMYWVEVATSRGFRAPIPRLLFELPGLVDGLDAARDRDGFLMIREVESDSPDDHRIEVALNWPSKLVVED